MKLVINRELLKDRGIVYDVRRIGHHILVSGSGGVTALSPVVEPTIAYKLTELLKSGIKSPWAVAGGGDDVSPVLVISEFGEVWMISPDLKMENFGFVEFMSDLGDDTLITYSDHEQCFYISDGTVSYMLTRYGLSSIFQCVSNVQSYGGALISAVKPLSDTAMYVKTEPTDFGLRAIKSVQCVELDVMGSDFLMGLYSSIQLGGTVLELTNQPVNPVGICSSKIAGLDISFKIYNSSYVDKLVRGIEVRYKLTDKRFLRGPYAGEARPRTDS